LRTGMQFTSALIRFLFHCLTPVDPHGFKIHDEGVPLLVLMCWTFFLPFVRIWIAG
jgi:hypothetical protein